MWLEVALGTMAGIIGSLAMVGVVLRYKRLADVHQARRFLAVVGLCIAAPILLLAAWPHASRMYSDYRSRQASIARAEREVEYCRRQKSVLIGRAELPNTAPRDPMGLNRILSQWEDVDYGTFMGQPNRRTELSAYGWLRLCHAHGVVSRDELDRVEANYRRNQDATDAELRKR